MKSFEVEQTTDALEMQPLAWYKNRKLFTVFLFDLLFKFVEFEKKFSFFFQAALVVFSELCSRQMTT